MHSSRQQTVTGLRAGFTLLELIVSTGLGVIVLGIVVSVLQVGGEGYGRASRRIDASVEARAALGILAEDLSVVRFDETFGRRTPEGAWPSDEIWFSVLKPRTGQDSSKAAGDLCFVYYYTSITQPLEENSGPFSRKLYRRLVSSADVMAALKVGERLDDPTPDPQALEDEAVAFNVVQFLVEPLIRTEEGEDQKWEKEGGRDPDVIKITLRVTDHETARLMTQKDDWGLGGRLAAQFLGQVQGRLGEVEKGKRLRTFEMIVPFER